MVAALSLLIGMALLAQNVSASVGKMNQQRLAAGASHGINAAPEITNTPTLAITNTPPPIAPTSSPTDTPTYTPARNAYNFLRPGSTSGNCPAPPNGGTTTVGCRFVLDLMLDAGDSRAPTGASAQQSYMTYTYQLIQVARVSAIGTSCVPTNTVTSDESVFDALLQDEICNGPDSCTFYSRTVGPGSFAHASGAIDHCPSGCPDPNQPPPQNQQVFRVAQVGLCVVAPGQAVFHWQFSPPAPSLRDTEIVNFPGDIVNDRSLYTDYVINIVDLTNTPTNTVTHTATPTPSPNPNCDYQITQSTGASIVPGTLDIGNHGAEAITHINLPFPVRLYGVGYNSANVSSSGKLHFSVDNGPEANACLPYGSLVDTILPYWDDLRTDTANAGCSIYASGCGVFTSISGTAPNRAFNIEWRTVYNNQRSQSANFEVRLYEGEDHFDIIYGQVDQGGSSATVGVQRDVNSNFTQFECNTGGLTQGLKLIFAQSPCVATPTFVPTRTPAGNAYHFLRPGSTAGNCPAPANGGATTVGCRFVLDLMVNAGSSVAPNGLTAEQDYLTYSYQLIQNARLSAIATSCVPTNTVTGDHGVFDATMQDEVCNGPNPCTFRNETAGPGSFAYSSAALSNCPEGCPDPNGPPPQNQAIFRIAQVGLCAIAPGQARFHWQFSPPAPILRDTEMVNLVGGIVNNPLLYTDYFINIAAPTNTPTPTRGPDIRGHGTWEGRQPQPDPSQMLPISLTLRLTTGGPYIDYPLQTTDASGQFTVSVAGLPNGTYNWRAKGPQFLANAGTITLTGNPVTNLEAGLLRTGDANGDNIVNVSDFNVLRDSFGTICGGAGYDGRADFTGDCSVNIQDFNLMKRNFGFSGAAPLH